MLFENRSTRRRPTQGPVSIRRRRVRSRRCRAGTHGAPRGRRLRDHHRRLIVLRRLSGVESPASDHLVAVRAVHRLSEHPRADRGPIRRSARSSPTFVVPPPHSPAEAQVCGAKASVRSLRNVSGAEPMSMPPHPLRSRARHRIRAPWSPLRPDEVLRAPPPAVALWRQPRQMQRSRHRFAARARPRSRGRFVTHITEKGCTDESASAERHGGCFGSGRHPPAPADPQRMSWPPRTS